MKKLFNGRFLFILASSLVVLLGLGLGAFYLFDDSDDTFIKSGYVLNPLSSTSEKYFFEEDTEYKENLSSMVEFKDVDDNEVSVLKDSFLHYTDESLSFLKRGAILDLDSISGTKAVSFYNITSESIIEKDGEQYVIESASGDIKLKNFIGRINDNKYIVVGNLSLKMAGNSTSIKGDYFEIVYVEEGIVNIENKEVKYQVTADGSLIYVGSDIVIDLGDKKITVKGEDVMSITAITIDGDENIEIIPKGNEDDDDQDDDSTGGDDGANAGQGDNTGNTDSTDGTGGEDGTGGTGEDGVDGELTEDVTVSLKDATIGSTSIDVVFDIINASDDDQFMLQVVNLTTGRTVDMVAQVLADVSIRVNLLTPNTKYLVMVINQKDNGKYFQKVMETTGFGIKLEKSYATSNSLAYKVTVEEGTDITNAKLSLYKYNEETKQNEIVTTSYVDSATGEIVTEEKITYLSSLSSLEGEHEIVYEGLDSNTIYTAVLDEFSVASSNFKDVYNITVTSMTLKKTPSFTEMIIDKDVGTGSFDLSLSNIVDDDNAIVSYTYVIYDRLENTMAIDPIVNYNAAPINVKIGDGENQLKNDTNYYYRVIIEYYDNEKYIEYVTTDSLTFLMGNDPYVTVVPKDDLITHEQIAATIYLKDNSCLISMPGREKCGGSSTTVVEVSEVNSVNGALTPVSTKLVVFDVDNETGEIKYDLLVTNLKPGTTYNIEVRANYNNSDSLDKQEILHTDESRRTIATRSLTTFNIEWEDLGSHNPHVVNLTTQFKADENTGTLSPEDSAKSIDRVEVEIYAGRNVDFETAKSITYRSYTNNNLFNIKEKFYDDAYKISSLDTFDLSIDKLKNLNGGKLSEYYTLRIKAFTGDTELTLVNNVLAYRVSPILLMGDIEEPVIELEGITNSNAGNLHADLTNQSTYVGYKVSAAFDRAQLIVNALTPEKINFYVYDINGNALEFYIMNDNGELEKTKVFTAQLGDSNYFETKIYMDYGSEYETVDELMRRGNLFYIGYVIEGHMQDGTTWKYPDYDGGDIALQYGLYKKVQSEKETPSIKMYVASSDENSITYNYEIKDPDHSIYKESESENYGFYVQVNGGNEFKIDLVKTSEEGSSYNQFAGTLTIDENIDSSLPNGLKNGDIYRLYYKKNVTKTGEFDSDVFDYLDGAANSTRMFDGYYDASENIDAYNFKYQIINDATKDNRVVIKILANENILDRIVSYKLNFKGSNGKSLDKELWKLTACDGDSEETRPRCLSVDYTELKDAGLKSDVNNNVSIKLTINALYDNGLTGLDFKVGVAEEEPFEAYPYCIMQDNSTEDGLGSYISITGSGTQITTWTDALGISKGYYTYQVAKIWTYKNQQTGKTVTIKANLSAGGYSSSNGILNPKMISNDTMQCIDSSENNVCENGFSFDSITPKIETSQKAAIINGAYVDLTLSGIDLADLENEGDEANPEYYLYVETWATKAEAEAAVVPSKSADRFNEMEGTVRPVVKVKIDEDDPIATITAYIDGLENNTTYYYNVYANLRNNNEYFKIQLFDAKVSTGYQVNSYSFKSLKATEIFQNFGYGYTSSEDPYGARTLDTKISLKAYSGGRSYNFDVVYILCHADADSVCSPEEGQHIIKRTIPLAELSSTINDSAELPADIEYNKNYLMYVYAVVDYYNVDGEKVKKNVQINSIFNASLTLSELTKPKFTVTREALLVDGDFVIDFQITPSDSDKTLVNGEYFVKLFRADDSTATPVGSLVLTDEDGLVLDSYGDHAFNATQLNKKIRITGLEPSTKYTFMVYSKAYLNNYSANTTPEERVVDIVETYTIFTTADYGVAFGEATYGITERSVVVTFLGGTNFSRVKEVSYTIGLWDDDQSSSTIQGTYVLEEDNKQFEFDQDADDWKFVIDPTDMKNTVGKTYRIILSFMVEDPNTGELIKIDSETVPSFQGTVTFYENKN